MKKLEKTRRKSTRCGGWFTLSPYWLLPLCCPWLKPSIRSLCAWGFVPNWSIPYYPSDFPTSKTIYRSREKSRRPDSHLKWKGLIRKSRRLRIPSSRVPLSIGRSPGVATTSHLSTPWESTIRSQESGGGSRKRKIQSFPSGSQARIKSKRKVGQG